MDDRTAGPDFWSRFLVGPVFGLDFGPDFFGPERNPEFGPKIKTDGNSKKK